jgi:ATP-dependent RNA helicase DeaD
MDTFEELGLRPELADALLAEGMEVPTALQGDAIPVLRKGNSALLRGGPGAGVLVAYGVPLLDRLEGGQRKPEALILTALPEGAVELARSLARPGAAVGLRVAALGGGFALPALADVLFGTPEAISDAISNGELKLDAVAAVVVEGAAGLLELPGNRERIDQLLDLLPSEEVQIVVVADPVTDAVRGLVDARARRAVHIPSDAASAEGEGDGAPIRRGGLRIRALEGDEAPALVAVVGELLEEGAEHLLLFFRNEDRAADLGDLLTLHGYAAGPAGDDAAPIWLGVDPLEARKALDEGGASGAVVVVSVDVPSDPDDLDRRHGGARGGGVILARPRELAHLRRIAREAGYELTPLPAPIPSQAEGIRAFRERVEDALRERDLAPYHLLLEPLTARYGSTEVAAALAALLRERRSTPEAAPVEGAPPSEAAASRRAPPAFVRLFLSVGSRDGVGAGDLLGAITGETGIPGSKVGRIDIRESFARVEVDESVAAAVIRSLNGTTLRGRSIRADYDRSQGRTPDGRGEGEGGRGGDRGGERGGSRGPRTSGGSGRPGSGPRPGPGGRTRGPGSGPKRDGGGRREG